MAMVAVEALLDGRRVLEAAPTLEQTEAFWESCKSYLAELITAGVLYKNESRHILEMPDGARIRTKTAWDADSLRGDYADLLILDEYATMDRSAWELVGAPMLLDNDGDAVFISTPKRRNHFHHLFARAQGDDTGRWEAWHFTSHDNPHLDEQALYEITADLTEDAYRQEILAEFLENSGAVFRNIPACCVLETGDPSEHQDHELVMGVDWGKIEDYTVASVGCRTCRQEVALDRFHGTSYRLARQRIAILSERWSVYDILAESNAMGQPIIDEMQYGLRVERPDLLMVSDGQYVFVHHRDGQREGPFNYGPIGDTDPYRLYPYDPRECRYGRIVTVDNPMFGNLAALWNDGEYLEALAVRGFATTASSKPPLIENLALTLEREEVHFIADPVATAELEAYEMRVSANTGRPTFSAPEGIHDDTVIARALMCKALQLRGSWMTLL